MNCPYCGSILQWAEFCELCGWEEGDPDYDQIANALQELAEGKLKSLEQVRRKMYGRRTAMGEWIN